MVRGRSGGVRLQALDALGVHSHAGVRPHAVHAVRAAMRCRVSCTAGGRGARTV